MDEPLIISLGAVLLGENMSLPYLSGKSVYLTFAATLIYTVVSLSAPRILHGRP